jgi:hypothetical protein
MLTYSFPSNVLASLRDASSMDYVPVVALRLPPANISESLRDKISSQTRIKPYYSNKPSRQPPILQDSVTVTPHSSLLTPHSSFLIPHSSFPIPHSPSQTTFATAFGISWIAWRTRSSLVRPSAWAEKLGTSRCRKTGNANTETSSSVT